MYKVYVGTKNPIKIKAVQQVMTNYEVIGEDVDSKVGKQPMDDDSTIRGALNRATSLPSRHLRIGLEAGVQRHGNILYLVNWGVLIGENNEVYYAGGTRIPLPKVISEKLSEKKQELAELMDSYYKTNNIKHNEGAVGFFTNNQVTRVDIFTHIVKLLYGQYLSNKGVIK